MAYGTRSQSASGPENGVNRSADPPLRSRMPPRRKRFSLARYDQDIMDKFTREKKSAAQIAEDLMLEHGINVPNLRKKVDDRMRYLKKNSLAPFPPTNPDNTEPGAVAPACKFAHCHPFTLLP